MQVRWFRYAFISCFFVCSWISLVAQDRSTGAVNGQITGQIRYADSGEPAYNVMVSCEAFIGGLIGQVQTDRSGRFRFSGLAPEQYNITVRVPGYFEERQTVELRTTPSGYVQLSLRPDKSRPAANNPGIVDVSIPAGAKREFDEASKALALGTKAGTEEAVRHLEKAVATYPNYYEANLVLGTAYMDLGQWDKAEGALKKTLQAKPDAANALFALGELYLTQKKEQEAEKALLAGLQAEPRSYQGHLNLARLYWEMAAKIKDDAEARPLLEKSYEEVKKSLELKPDFAPAHVVKGNLLLRVRRAEDAQHEFEEYLRLEPKGRFAEQAKATIERIKKALDAERANKKPE